MSGATVEDTIARLREYWRGEGCVALPACDFEIPSGTMHPQLFFALLGPEPWRAAVLQPVRRPRDARDGRHPYRLARHLQFQVLWKPPPGDLRERYLASLETLGLEPRRHDLRFVDWRFEPRSLDARGAGWRTLVDGLGVSRITYLERAAGRVLEPPSVEISYGIERLSMALQGAAAVDELRWSGELGYRPLQRRAEAEYGRWVHEVFDPEGAMRRLERLRREAERCLEAGLPVRAYERAIGALEELDALEARGDFAARERRDRLAGIGELVAAAAEAYLGRAGEPGDGG